MNYELNYQKRMDKNVVKQLKLNGDILKEKRNITYYFYFPTDKKREEFTNEMTKITYKFQNNHDYFDEPDDYPYGVVLTNYTDIDLEQIQKQTEKFISIAKLYGGIYDGWETEVVRNLRN